MSAAIVYAEWWWTCDYCGAICEEPYDSEPEALLASDEHGIICATDAAGSIGERLAKDYARLLESMDKRR